MELMIAVALIAILTSIIITSARFSDTQKNLNLEANKLQAAVRLAQSYSLSIPAQSRSNICGFGVYFEDDNETYHIYYTWDGDLDDETTCDDLMDPTDPNVTTKENIEIFSLNTNKTKIQKSSGEHVFFRTPYGNVGQVGSLVVTSSGASGGTKTIDVSSTGRIDLN